MLYKNVIDLIGNTPLVKLQISDGQTALYAKLEKYNLTGSSKDRIALKMIEDAFKKGFINDDTTIIEPTSGNTGIAIAAICAVKNLKCIIVMPENMSKERINYLRAYKAEIVLTNKNQGMRGALNKAKELLEEIPNSCMLSQFDNPNNPLAHYNTTGLEILKDLPIVEAVIAGIGTGGTISGVGRYLKTHKPNIKIFGVEPKTSPLITENRYGVHKIQGIGPNFLPQNFQKEYIDEVITVTDFEAYEASKMLSAKEGLFVGISSGAALAAALKIKDRFQHIVIIMPDGGEKYLSVEGFVENDQC